MEQITLKQENIDKYVATTEEFWRDFYNSLEDPLSEFNGFKNVSFERLTEYCWSVTEIKKELKALFEFPLLKKEYFLFSANEFILTNYRLVILDKKARDHSIPLSKLKKFSEQGDGEIIYEKNGQDVKLQFKEEIIDPKLISDAKSKFSETYFDKYQIHLLSNSIYDLNQLYPDLSIPKVDMYPLSKEKMRKAKGLNKDQIVYTSFQAISNNPKLTGFVVVVFLITLFTSLGGNGYNVIEEKDGVVTAETEIEYNDYELTSQELAEVIWNIVDDYSDAEKITLKVTMNGKNKYGDDASDELSPYVMDRNEINEVSKYEEDTYVYVEGTEYVGTYLMKNGYYK
ncbi:MAG: hypothetical protein K9I68_00225 [Bacteroidales bacterium]|nr:hypothetical protein [Bacteroidales bacterium]MCF8336404.1 hypothetical protein [Bacteroidales bacterium]